MRVHVDADRCVGHGRCYEICPEVFDEDEEGHASARPGSVPPALEDPVRRAEANCPEHAILVAP